MKLQTSGKFDTKLIDNSTFFSFLPKQLSYLDLRPDKQKYLLENWWKLIESEHKNYIRDTYTQKNNNIVNNNNNNNK